MEEGKNSIRTASSMVWFATTTTASHRALSLLTLRLQAASVGSSHLFALILLPCMHDATHKCSTVPFHHPSRMSWWSPVMRVLSRRLVCWAFLLPHRFNSGLRLPSFAKHLMASRAYQCVLCSVPSDSREDCLLLLAWGVYVHGWVFAFVTLEPLGTHLGILCL